MGRVEVGEFSLQIVREQFNQEDSHSVVCKGPPNSIWNVSLVLMNPSGPSSMLTAPAMTMDAAGEAKHPGMGMWPSGLYVVQATRIEGANASEPHEDVLIAPKFWLGDDEPADLDDAFRQAKAEQAAFRDREIRADGFTGDNRLRLQVLIDGCLLDYSQNFEGGILTALGDALKPQSILDAVHKILPQNVRFDDTNEIYSTYARGHPLCLATFVNVQAAGHSEAIAAVLPRLKRVMAGLGEGRGATPHPIAFVSDRTDLYSLSIDEGIYRGNLVAGFAPGVTYLLDLYERAAQNNPWIDFALELMRVVRAQKNAETQLFMAWSLIEAAAKRKVSAAATVLFDDSGAALPGRGGQPLKQSSDLGRVIVYLRDHVGRNMLGLQVGASHDFYDQIFLAYRCRNQIAHEGGIHVPGAAPITGYSAQFAFTVKDWAAEVVRYEAVEAAR